MPLLNPNSFMAQNGFPAQPFSEMWLYHGGGDTLAPIYKDSGLTVLEANPIKADASGVFPLYYVMEGDYEARLHPSKREELLGHGNIETRAPLVLGTETAHTFSSIRDLLDDDTLTYDAAGKPNFVTPGDIIRVLDANITYLVIEQAASEFHAQTQGNIKLDLVGRNQFAPEAFGAKGDGIADDTLPWNCLIKAALTASANGPVKVEARGSYLVSQLLPFSQVPSTDGSPYQQDSIVFDLDGAKFQHDGTGDGILDLEGYAATRFRYEISGGIFYAAPNTKWLIRARDVRGSTFSPEAMIGPSASYGMLVQNWRSWSENNQIGGNRTFEARNMGHGLGFQGRKYAWAWELTQQGLPTDAANYQDEATSDPAPAATNAYYYNTATEQVRRYDGTSWSDVMAIDTVASSIAGKSFARTKIHNILQASAHDPALDGLAIEVQGASLYDSEINGVRGNVPNGGGSLIYWNDNYALNTVIRNVGVEQANQSGAPESYVFRIGPDFLVATEPPLLENISWSGGYAKPTDPAAGVAMMADFRDCFVTTTANTATEVLAAGVFHPNTVVEVVVKNNANTLLGRALVGRKNSSASLNIQDMAATRSYPCFYVSGLTSDRSLTKMESTTRFVAPRGGSIVGITAKTDATVSAGSVNVQLRHNVGDLNTNGGNKGVEATIDAGHFASFTQDPGVDVFDPGDDFYAVYQTTGMSGPTAVQATIELLIDGPVKWSESNGSLMVTTETDETLRLMTKVWKS